MTIRDVRQHVTALAMLVSVTFVASTPAQSPQDSSSQWKAVEEAMGRPGKQQPDSTFKFSMPRKDLKVTVAGTPISPGLRSAPGRHLKGRRPMPW
jgi:hypothetical protein